MADKQKGSYRVEFLGGLRLHSAGHKQTLPGTRKVQSLLAYLAYHVGQPQPREELIDLLWPDADLDAGRNRLNNALSTLRTFLEPSKALRGSILDSPHASACLRADAVETDVAEVEAARHALRRTPCHEERLVLWGRIASAYEGEFLPGFYEDWALVARAYFEVAYREAAQPLIKALWEAGNLDRALHHALRAVRLLPEWEQPHIDLVGLYSAAGLPSAARRQYDELVRILAESGEELPAEIRDEASRFLRVGAGPTAVPPTHRPATLAGTPSTVPEALPRYFGHEDELRRLDELLRTLHGDVRPEHDMPDGNAPRLITLTGPAGTGKTRLAQEALARQTCGAEALVAFVSLSSLSEAALLPAALAAAVGQRVPPAADPLDAVAEGLAGRSVLLVLDNLEHLLPDARSFVSALLGRIPRLTCLATSRQRLRLPGECEMPVDPLPVPPDGESASDNLLAYSAVRLFIDRARLARPDFGLTSDNAAAVGALCRRLEGLPLALELAAAWAGVLTPAQMLSRLERRLSLLVSRRPGGDPRHASLHAALEWSRRLLAPGERRFLANLSVFRGGWTLEAAEAVCEEPLALEYLGQLHERSLVATKEIGAEMRYSLLETVREFAADLLGPEEAARLAERHAGYFRRAALDADPRQRRDMDRLEQEAANWRAALSWHLEAPGGIRGTLEMVGKLGNLWLQRGFFREGRRWAGAALNRSDEGLQNDAGLQAARSQAYVVLGNLARYQGDLREARAAYDAGLRAAEKTGDTAEVSKVCNALGNLAWMRADFEEAREWYERALVSGGDALTVHHRAGILENLGNCCGQCREYERADDYYSRSRALYEADEDSRGVARVAHNQGTAAGQAGRLDEAMALMQEGLAVRWRLGDQIGTAYGLEGVADVLARQGEGEKPVRLWAAAEALRERIGAAFPAEELGQYQERLRDALSSLGESVFVDAWSTGRRLPLDQAVQDALGAERRADLT